MEGLAPDECGVFDRDAPRAERGRLDGREPGPARRSPWRPGIHVLRHTAAKLRRDASESIESVSAFLDHSSLAVTSVYLRRLEGEVDRTWPDVAAAIGV